MGELIFENSMGERRVIANCRNYSDVMNAISAFIRTCNSKKRNPNDHFHSYYTRVWEEDGMAKIDVGSHVEFFYAPREFFNL